MPQVRAQVCWGVRARVSDTFIAIRDTKMLDGIEILVSIGRFVSPQRAAEATGMSSQDAMHRT